MGYSNVIHVKNDAIIQSWIPVKRTSKQTVDWNRLITLLCKCVITVTTATAASAAILPLKHSAQRDSAPRVSGKIARAIGDLKLYVRFNTIRSLISDRYLGFDGVKMTYW